MSGEASAPADSTSDPGSESDAGSPTFDRRTLAKAVVGFAVAGVLLYLLGSVVGWERITRALADADPLWVAVACASTLLYLLAWTKTWDVVLTAGAISVSYRRLVPTFFAATFANYTTPFGQAGGEPFIAYVLATDTEASYEQSLASVSTADLLNLFPFFTFAGLGLAALALSLPLDPLLVVFLVPASSLAGITPTPGGLGGVEAALVALVVALTPIAAGPAAALAIAYRATSYWFALVTCGPMALYVTARA